MWITIGLLITWLSCPVAYAQGLSEFDDQAAIEAGKDSLSSRRSVPWYDSSEDTIRRIDVEEKTPPAAARDWALPTRKKMNWNWPNWSLGRFFGRLLQVLAWIILAVVLIGGLYLMVRGMVESELIAVGEGESADTTVTDAQRIENLPFKVRKPTSDFLAEARRYYSEGNYGEAIIYLFSYQLIQLDKNQWIRLAKGKTNRQYLREVRQKQDLRGLVHTTMVAFEDFFFGQHPIDKSRFDACWEKLDQFHELVKPEGGSV
ncbi:MAG: DUF4129 domain-containing protein [Planctomycetota bacterium]